MPSVSRTLLTDRPLTVGDPIDVALIIYHERDEKPAHPSDENAFAPFSLRETSVKAKRLRGGITRTMVIYTLTIYATGTYGLEPAEVTVGETVLKTDPLEIRILSVLPQESGDIPLKDIVPPFNPRVRPLFVFLICGAIAACAVLFHFVRRLLRNRRTALQETAEAQPEPDPYLATITALESLKREHADRKTGVKEAYSRISAALRFFVGKIAGIDALKMTTAEIGRKLRRAAQRGRGGSASHPAQPSRPPVSLPSDRIVGVLRKSDLVKFAKATPDSQAVAEDIEETSRIVEEVHASMERAAREAEAGASGGGNV